MKYVQFSTDGTIENIVEQLKDFEDKNYSISGIRDSTKTGKRYKGKFFRRYENEEEIQDLDVPPLCWIKNTPFYLYSDIVDFTGLTRQAVYQNKKNKRTVIAKMKIKWNPEGIDFEEGLH